MKILLRSSWQYENIGDIAHTPGMLALLERHHPAASVTLWPKRINRQVGQILQRRFPKLRIVRTDAQAKAALRKCDFILHGSGPSLVGWGEMQQAADLGKPYGVGGITLPDEQISGARDLLAGAKFLYLRDSDSMKAVLQSDLRGPHIDFGPDATFALDLRDDKAADQLLKHYKLKPGKFLCAIPRLRWTPYWEIRPDVVKPSPEKSAINEAFADRDHAKLRYAIAAWVRQTGMPVFLVPEMTYAVSRLRPLLFDPLPHDVKPHVRVLDRYWLTDEAMSVYAKAAAVVSFEQHSPIMAIASGTPAVLLRQPTDTRKGQMWRDIGLNQWIFEIDDSTGQQIAKRLLQIASDLPAARKTAKKAKAYAHLRMKMMMEAIKL